MWTIPNLLTLARIVVIVPLVAMIDAGLWVGAFALFVAAAATDWLDGWLARRWNQQSDLGRMLDPIADKLIVAAVLVATIYVQADAVRSNARTQFIHGPELGPDLWVSVAILTREIIVSGLREYLGPKQVTVPVSKLAKGKTALQLAGLAFILLGNALWPYTPPLSLIASMTALVGSAVLAMSALLAWITAFAYLRAGLRHMEPVR